MRRRCGANATTARDQRNGDGVGHQTLDPHRRVAQLGGEGHREGVQSAEPAQPDGDHVDGGSQAAISVANLSMAGGSLNSFGTVIGLPNPSSTTQDCLLSGVSATSNGYNFEQGGVDATSCGLHGTGDVQNGADPNLGALGANGGPTNTQVPQTGSPLINVIPIPACGAPPPGNITTDQRGVTRPQQTGCEIGAVEVLAPPAPVVIQPTFTG